MATTNKSAASVRPLKERLDTGWLLVKRRLGIYVEGNAVLSMNFGNEVGHCLWEHPGTDAGISHK